VKFIIKKYGWDMIKDMISALSRKDSIESALKPHGLTMYLLEKEWMMGMK